MSIKSKKLTEKYLQLQLSSADSITGVYLDKASNYSNAYSSIASKHSFIAQYSVNGSIVNITLPSNITTFFTITLITSSEVVVSMYLNEFSLFKAKSKYLQIFDSCCNNLCNNSTCIACNEKTKRYNMLAYMLRINLFQQSYLNNNIELAVKYYTDACRVYNMDNIFFEYKNIDRNYYIQSGNLNKLFDTLNEWIKGNACQCEKKVLESLLIADLYSLIFGNLDYESPSTPETPQTTDYMYYGYLAMSDVAEFKTMRDQTHDFSLLKEQEVLNGITRNTIKKEYLTSKQVNVTTPEGGSCLFVLIPITSNKVGTKFDGISSFVPFAKAGVNGKGFESNGNNVITIDKVQYKIYGENSVIDGETTIKIS